MIEVDPIKIEEVYVNFCTIMGFNKEKWNSILEFTAFVGLDLVDIREFNKSEYCHNTASKIAMLHGPHADTLLKAYKVRRNSLSGRLRANAETMYKIWKIQNEEPA